jgi:two-component system, OmpR family, response regulator
MGVPAEFVSADEFPAQMHFRSGGFMPVTALSARAGRPSSHATGPGVVAAIRRPVAEPGPALTLTVAIPLTNESLSPQAHKLIEAVRELVEVSQGTVTVTQPPPVRFEEPAAEGTGPEVRLLTASRQVFLDGEVLPLTRLEFDLLLFLAENPRRVFTRGQLLAGVWGYEHTGERTVDVHVRRLRVKLGGTVPLVTTVYGVGYRLADDARVLILPQE